MRLTDPDLRYHRSYLCALAEFTAAAEGRHAGLPSWPAEGGFAGVDFTGKSLQEPEAFNGLVGFLLSQRESDTPRPRAYVPFTELWMVQGEEYVGRIVLRHELNEILYTWGGHIGYAVRPSARGNGHAFAALLDMLEVCRARGIDPALVTCDPTNEASRRTIEKAGGEYEESREGRLRYWLPVD